jgi:hypothetical protein
LFFAAGIGQAVFQQHKYLFKMTPFEVCRSTYGRNPFHESPTIAAYLQEHTEPQDRIAVLGSEPQIFFYSKRRSVSAQIYMHPLMEQHQFAKKMQTDFIKDIEEHKPKYIVDFHVRDSWGQNKSSSTYILDWKQEYLKSHYQLVGTVELYDDRTEYQWEDDIKPISAENAVLIYERIIKKP